MGNCISFKSPTDEVAHPSQLAVVADIAEAPLVAAREHEVIIEESEDKSWSNFANVGRMTLKLLSGTHIMVPINVQLANSDSS